MSLAAVVPIKPKVNEELVELLGRLHEQAKEGKIRSVALCYANSNGTIATAIEVDGDKFAMSHAIGALWWRFQQKMHEDAYQPES